MRMRFFKIWSVWQFGEFDVETMRPYVSALRKKEMRTWNQLRCVLYLLLDAEKGRSFRILLRIRKTRYGKKPNPSINSLTRWLGIFPYLISIRNRIDFGDENAYFDFDPFHS